MGNQQLYLGCNQGEHSVLCLLIDLEEQDLLAVHLQRHGRGATERRHQVCCDEALEDTLSRHNHPDELLLAFLRGN